MSQPCHRAGVHRELWYLAPQEAEYLTASIARIRVYIFRLSKLSPDESD